MNITGIQEVLENNKLDFALFYNLDSTKINPNMFYFSGYTGLGSLVISKKQKPFLIVPKMELQRAKNSMIKKVYSLDKKRFFESISAIIKKNRIKSKNIAIDNSSFTLNAYRNLKKQFKNIKTKDISLNCLKLRQIKSSNEITKLKKACGYGDKILTKAIKNFRDFRTEAEVAAFLEYEAKKLGLGLAFNPVVASGSNGSMPHHEPGNVKLKRGFCVIDFGVTYKGYCSDITRTIHLGGISKKDRGIYNFLLGVQKEIINDIKIGGICGKIYEDCVKKLGRNAKYFIHGLGHGIGAEIHELPNLTLDSKDKISENMVFTIEPGIYLTNKFGIRIEDDILMKRKPDILTKATKDLLIV